MLRRRRAAQINRQSIPYGSTKVEYLESYNVNGPWIQTGLISNGLNIDVTASHHVGKSGDGNVVCGSQTGGVRYKICGNTSKSCGWLFQDEGVTEWKMLSFPNLGDIWNLKLNFQNLSVHMSSGEKSSTTYFNERYYELSDDLYFTLFGCGTKDINSVTRGNGFTEQVRIYKFSANKDGIHNIINLIPSLDKTGTPCMFDKVTRKNFYNAGTGQFIYPTTSMTYSLRIPQAEWAKITDTGVHKIYHTPIGYEGSLEEYAIENGYKQLIETESPNEEGKYYSFKWVETDDTLTTEWFEIDPPQEEFFEENLDNPTE